MKDFRNELARIVQNALAEDLPDVTSDAIFAPDERGSARFLVKGNGIAAGLAVIPAVFRALDPAASVEVLIDDGKAVSAGDIIATVEATVRALLSGERTALNLLQRACGIATTTRRYVNAVAGTKALICDTRKTAPGLRALDKLGVRAGGGTNHRFGLFDMVLVKNNHIDRAGSIEAALTQIRKTAPGVPVMIEVRDLEELAQAASQAPDYILLDNMSLETMREAVERIGGRITLEASGGITLDNVRAVAETGVDRISIGALTHSVIALDISMRIECEALRELKIEN